MDNTDPDGVRLTLASRASALLLHAEDDAPFTVFLIHQSLDDISGLTLLARAAWDIQNRRNIAGIIPRCDDVELHLTNPRP